MRFSFPISIFCSLLLASRIINPVLGMNKAELIDAMASSSGLSKGDSKRALEGLLHGIEFGLQDFSRNNGSVYIAGFGAFVRTTNKICDSKDDDCNGRFLCNSTLPDRGGRDVSIACGGSVCNGVDDLSRGVSSERCTNGVDDDCDLLVDDDDDSLSTLSAIDFELDEMGDDESEFGKFYFNYWTEVILTLANDLDNLANKSYIIAPNRLQSDNSVISEGSSSPKPGTAYKGDFMDTVVYWMTIIRDYLDPDSDDDGIIDAMRRSCECKGHVTVLKLALTQSDLVEKFGEHAGLSLDLTTYVKNFLLEAVRGLEIINNPLNPLVDDTDAILVQMAYEISRVQVDNIGSRQQFGPVQQQRNQDDTRKLNPTKTATAYHPPLRRELDPLVENYAVLGRFGYYPEEALEKSKSALDAFISATTNALKKGDRISLIQFGSFSISKRAARTGRNPQTGKAIKIAAKKVVKFKAGADLAKKVN